MCRAIGLGKSLATIAGACQESFDQALVFPRQPPEQDGYIGAFLCQKGKLLRV